MLLILLVLLLLNVQAAGKFSQVTVVSATAQSIHDKNEPDLVFDGEVNTYYHSVYGASCAGTEWLRLELVNEATIGYVEVVNR